MGLRDRHHHHIRAHRCLRKNASCRVLVTENCDVPAKHEANVPVKLLGSDHLYPQTDWNIEPCELQKGVVAARTLVSSDQKWTVARVCNYSNEPIEFKANTFLGLAEPAKHVPGTGQKTVEPSLKSCSDSTNVTVQTGKRSEHRRPRKRPRSKPEAMLYSCASIVSVTPSAQVTEPVASAPDGNPYVHVQCLIDDLPDDLTTTQSEMAAAFIQSRAHVFSRSEFDIGRTRIIPHRIDIGDSKPHFEQLRCHPTAQLPLIDEHVEEMLKHDVIEPAASPWCSNVVMVQKQDGTMRFCVNYRKTNELTIKDKFPFPKNRQLPRCSER